jgi:hypothetical protein
MKNIVIEFFLMEIKLDRYCLGKGVKMLGLSPSGFAKNIMFFRNMNTNWERYLTNPFTD